jgi:K+-transporting ATPase KdpF subunit
MKAELSRPSVGIFPHCMLTGAALACFPASGAEVGRGYRIHTRHCGPLCGLALDHLGDLAARGRAVSAADIVSGLLALGLCVYLLYAMFKPEKF